MIRNRPTRPSFVSSLGGHVSTHALRCSIHHLRQRLEDLTLAAHDLRSSLKGWIETFGWFGSLRSILVLHVAEIGLVSGGKKFSVLRTECEATSSSNCVIFQKFQKWFSENVFSKQSFENKNMIQSPDISKFSCRQSGMGSLGLISKALIKPPDKHSNSASAAAARTCHVVCSTAANLAWKTNKLIFNRKYLLA